MYSPDAVGLAKFQSMFAFKSDVVSLQQRGYLSNTIDCVRRYDEGRYYHIRVCLIARSYNILNNKPTARGKFVKTYKPKHKKVLALPQQPYPHRPLTIHPVFRPRTTILSEISSEIFYVLRVTHVLSKMITFAKIPVKHVTIL